MPEKTEFHWENYWYRENLPTELSRFVCRCYTFKPGFDHKKRLVVCERCGKLPIYFVNRCRKCNSIFVKDFHSLGYCPANPHCWNCVDKQGPLCEHIPQGLRRLHEERGLVPPQFRREVDISDFSFDFEE